MVEDGRDIRTNELSWSMFPRVLKSPYFWLLVPLVRLSEHRSTLATVY